MRVPFEWLTEMAPVDEPADVVAERLSLCSLEVEEVLRPLSGVVVARIADQSPHPNADRLTLCTVETGEGETRPIVCGARNVKAGDRVALALPGTTLPNGAEIKKSKIRGEVSEGMLCAADELGLGDDHAGILILPEDAPLGAPAAAALGLGSAVLDVDVLPDRGDCASVVGVAREVAALYDVALQEPDSAPAESGAPAADGVSVEVREPARCPRYMARVVRGVRVGPSPEWLARRLVSVGQRPINNVVDVTNFILHELGQPLHAFDAAAIPEGRIVVRCAGEGERIRLLDESEIELAADDLVIADRERPIALAGVMGGAETAVGEATRDVILEAACFAPRSVRRSARRHRRTTDSSYRFERGVDPVGVERAVARAARLLAEVAGGSVAPGALDVQGELPERAPVELRFERVPRFLGVDLAEDEVLSRLRRVGIATERANGSVRCTPPSWRWDLAQEADVLEEVVRLGGYDAVPATLPEGTAPSVAPDPIRLQNAEARRVLRDLGYSEAVHVAFVSQTDLARLGLEADPRSERAVPLLNPIGEELALLRTTLLPGLLRSAARNLRHGVSGVRQFEIGRCFFAREGAELPEERRVLAALAVPGDEAGLWGGDDDSHFFETKHAVEALAAVLRKPVFASPGEGSGADTSPHLHPGAAARLICGERLLGELGRLHPAVADAFEVPAGSVCFELDLDALEAAPGLDRSYQEPPKYPAVKRDLALVVPKGVSAAEAQEEIRRAAGKRLEEVVPFDVYAGKGIPADRKSVAFRLTLRAPDRTLAEKEIAKIMDKVTAALKRSLGAELR